MEQQYLIDSNVVIDYLSGKLPENGKHLLNHLINIAATALSSGFILLTRNKKDFDTIKGLEIFNPYEL